MFRPQEILPGFLAYRGRVSVHAVWVLVFAWTLEQSTRLLRDMKPFAGLPCIGHYDVLQSLL